MSYQNWRDAVAEIDKRTGTITPQQKALFEAKGEVAPVDLPSLVVAARLQTVLAQELGLLRPAQCSDGQLEYIENLETERDRVSSVPLDAGEARAWIAFLLLKRRRYALENIKVEAGDVVEVEVEDSEVSHVEEVSSIGGNGRLHFRGGGGAGSWPDSVTVLCKKTDLGANAAAGRKDAANNAAARGKSATWSEPKQRELERFQVTRGLGMDDVDRLEVVLENATDERPLQFFLQENPHVLGALLGGHRRYVLPQVRFGDKYVADFLLCDVNSLGMRWILVELETPLTQVTLKSSSDLDQHARKGISQIREWREWLTMNLAYAVQSRVAGGLGLFDIRPGSEGLVLVGRRQRLLENSYSVRNPPREDSGVRIHTYDWLLEQLRGVLSFSGPPALNPHLLQPD